MMLIFKHLLGGHAFELGAKEVVGVERVWYVRMILHGRRLLFFCVHKEHNWRGRFVS